MLTSRDQTSRDSSFITATAVIINSNPAANVVSDSALTVTLVSEVVLELEDNIKERGRERGRGRERASERTRERERRRGGGGERERERERESVHVVLTSVCIMSAED